MADQVFGFVQSVCGDIAQMLRAFKGGKMNKPPRKGSSHPEGGPIQTFVLLDDLGPANPTAEKGGTMFSARALRLVPTDGCWCQYVFCANNSTVTLSGSTGSSVWGQGTTINTDDDVDDESTYTITAQFWFYLYAAASSAPALLTCTNPAVRICYVDVMPVDGIETVYMARPWTCGQQLKAGQIVEAFPMPGGGFCVFNSQSDEVEGILTSAITKATDPWSGASTATMTAYVPNPASTTSPNQFMGTSSSSITIVNRDPSFAAVSGKYARAKKINGEYRISWIECP